MHSSIIVVPGHCAEAGGELRIDLQHGESLVFGRSPCTGDRPCGGSEREPRRLTVPHEGISRTAGVVTAGYAFWSLTNLSRHQTYVVENPEGAGEYMKVAPGRQDAPVPFEFGRLVIPARAELVAFDVWSPRHTYQDPSAARSPGSVAGPATAPAFPLDRGSRYFLVLIALCEPRLRGDLYAPLPTTEQLVQRLRPLWPAAGRTSVQWNIDYLAVKLRLKSAPEEAAEDGARLNGKKELLASVALRFDLVDESDLSRLSPRGGRAGG